MPAARPLLEWPLVVLGEQLPDGVVQLAQGEEGSLAEAGKNPVANRFHARLDLRFILRVALPGRNHRQPVMPSEIQAGGVQYRFVQVRVLHDRKSTRLN